MSYMFIGFFWAKELISEAIFDVCGLYTFFYETPCIFFLIFNISRKSMNQKLLEIVQVTVPIFFYIDKNWKMKQL